MLIKAGVDISRLNREIRRALSTVSDLFSGHDAELVITSTYEGNHSAGSLHYSNDAFDCRYSLLHSDFGQETFLDSLGDEFDVVFYLGHIHIEYDPKT